jgi:hypothetical protein
MQYLIILIESDADVVGSIEFKTDNAALALKNHLDSCGYTLMQSYWTGSTLNAIDVRSVENGAHHRLS